MDIVGTYPGIIIIVLVVGILCYVALNHTKFGRSVRGMGGAERTAGHMGVPIRRVRILSFVVCGALVGLASMILAARVGAATPTSGQGFEFQVISAVVIGGTALTGGVGSIQGAFVGALVITIIGNLLTIIGVTATAQNVVAGAIFIVAVVATTDRSRIHVLK
jgi:ribose/xylose/arabinose/galactoside ABC-type transport system permease subunit